MWAQSWGNIYSILEPYPGQGRESLTTAMEAQVSIIANLGYETISKVQRCVAYSYTSKMVKAASHSVQQSLLHVVVTNPWYTCMPLKPYRQTSPLVDF